MTISPLVQVHSDMDNCCCSCWRYFFFLGGRGLCIYIYFLNSVSNKGFYDICGSGVLKNDCFQVSKWRKKIKFNPEKNN